MRQLLEAGFRGEELAMEERLGRTTIAQLARRVLAIEREVAQRGR